MCLAIYAPEGSRVSHGLVKRAWNNNPDGAGIMFLDETGLRIEKFLYYEKDLWEFYKSLLIEDVQDRDVVMHFRFATHGCADEVNCHPVEVLPGVGMVHNGIIHIDQKKEDPRSDTRAFAEEYLSKLPPDFMLHPGILHLIGYAIGKGSKLIFMNASGLVRIVNEGEGFWRDGIWYSNSSGDYAEFYRTPMVTDYSRTAGWKTMCDKWEDLPEEQVGDTEADEVAICSWCDVAFYTNEPPADGDQPLCEDCQKYLETYKEETVALASLNTKAAG
jgi:hypothetical protein